MGGVSVGSVYNTALSGNQARLNQPIPVIYGRMRTFPDFACQPYGFYHGNDQFYNVVLCVGQGEYVFEAINIDDTPIANFSSVYYKILPPGTMPERVLANIVTAIEVAGNVLAAGVVVGGFAVNKPRTEIDKIYWDILCEQGLANVDPENGNFNELEVEYLLDIQYIDEFGQPTSAWQNLETGSVVGATRTPQRFTFEADLPTPGRVLARFKRTTAHVDSSYVSDTITLGGLRGRLTTEATLCATATYLEVQMRANEQLNGLTQKKIATIVRRKLPTWDPIGGWSANVETRSICWAAVDKLKSTVYGDSLTDAGIDLQTFYDLDQIYAARQDRLDILFDSRVTSKDANRTIGQVGRAVIFQRMGVFTITRDQYQALPVASYTTRDIIPGSTSIGYALATPETPDAIDYEYFDNRSWDWVPIRCNLPGVVTAERPVTLRVSGITGRTHARREGTYLAAVNLYRRKFPKWQTEMKGILASYGSAVIFSPALPKWGQPGDLVDWDLATLTATVTEPLVWTAGARHFVTLERSTGQLTIAIPVLPGAAPNQMVLELDPGFTPNVDDVDRERTKYVFGPEGQHQKIVRLLGVTGKGKTQEGNPIIELTGVAENNLVHTADNADLPAGGVIQDPVPTTTVADALFPPLAPGEDPLNRNVRFIGESLTTGDDGTDNGSIPYDPDYQGGGFSLKLNADGTAAIQIFENYHLVTLDSPSQTDALSEQWLPGTLEPGDTAKFEARVLAWYFNGNSYYYNGPFDVSMGESMPFTNLGTDQRWVFGAGSADRATGFANGGDLIQKVFSIRVEIRHVGTTTNLVDTTMSWIINFF